MPWFKLNFPLHSFPASCNSEVPWLSSSCCHKLIFQTRDFSCLTLCIPRNPTLVSALSKSLFKSNYRGSGHPFPPQLTGDSSEGGKEQQDSSKDISKPAPEEGHWANRLSQFSIQLLSYIWWKITPNITQSIIALHRGVFSPKVSFLYNWQG